MADPASADGDLRDLKMGDLSRRRADLVQELERAEERWVSAGERLEEYAG
jgi:hypothetical protein